MQNTNHKEWEEISDFSAGSYAVTEGCDVGHADEALLIHGLIEGEVTHLEQHHCASPEHHQTGMGHVGAKQTA